MKARRFAMVAAIAASLLIGRGSTIPAQADQTAVNFLQPYVQWAQTQAQGPCTYSLNAVLVSLQPNGLASYANGGVGEVTPVALGLYNHVEFVRPGFPPIHIEGFSTDAALGDAAQFFNFRPWSPPSSGIFPPEYPFSPYATDQLAINLDAHHGRLIVRLDSWGGGIQTADLHAANGVLIGTIQGTSNPATVVISIQKAYYPPIR